VAVAATTQRHIDAQKPTADTFSTPTLWPSKKYRILAKNLLLLNKQLAIIGCLNAVSIEREDLRATAITLRADQAQL
jgi:hypothetical protein